MADIYKNVNFTAQKKGVLSSMKKKKEIINSEKEDKKDIKDTLVACIVFLLVLAIVHCVFPCTIVEGRSMLGTLHNGDIGITNTLEKKPNRGDIVIIKSKMDEDGRWIKRVIGLPGETISAKGGKVYINGEVINEPYLSEEYGKTSDFVGVTLGKDEYFVMGDNRQESADSRIFGAFKQSDIIATWKFKSGLLTTINGWVKGEN